MPFCSNCGIQLKPESRFCNACGAPVDAVPGLAINSKISPISEQGNIRQASIEEMKRMIAYFGQKQAQYDEYDDCVEKISYYSDPATVVKVDDQFQWRGSTGRPQVIIGIILTIIFGMNSLFWILILIAGLSNSKLVVYGSPNAEIELTVIGIIGTVLTFLLFGLGIFLQAFGNKKLDKYYKHSKDLKVLQQSEKERLLMHYEDRYDQLSEELSLHYTKYGYCPVSAPYTNPKILQEIFTPINIGRADTIKEAINVLIQDKHYSEMELQATLTARSARSAARGAKVAAFFTAASFFTR